MSIWHMDIKAKSVLFAQLAADAYGMSPPLKKSLRNMGLLK